MSIELIFHVWPEDGDVREVWFTKIEGEGVVTQASLEFSRRAAVEKANALNQRMPGLASVLGPYRLTRTPD